MSKKIYETFANKIYNQDKIEGFNHEVTKGIVRFTSDIFASDNPLFQLDKYERACYEGLHIRKSIKNE